MEDYKSQFIEIHSKLDKLFELLPNLLRSQKIEPPDLAVVPSAQANSGKNDADVVFDGMSNPESKHCVELQEAEDVRLEMSGDLVVQLEAYHGKSVSLNADHDVLDELPKPALASTAYKLIDDDLDVCSELNTQEEATYNHNFGDSENGALKMLNNSTEPNFIGLNHFSGNFYSYPMFDEVDLYFHKVEMPLNGKVQHVYSIKHNVTEVVYQVFDKMTDPRQIALHPFSLLSSFGNAETNESASIKSDNRSVEYKLIFDPGGCFRPHMGCSSFKCCNEEKDYCWGTNVAESLIIVITLIMCLVDVFPQYLISIRLAEPKKESHANKAFTSLNLYLSFKEFIENVDGSSFAKQKEMLIAHIMLDEMPMLFSFMPFEKIDGEKCYIPLIDGIPRVFDPGISIINGDLGAEVMLSMPWPSFCIYNELIQSSVIETARSKSSTGRFCSISTIEKVGMFSLNSGVQLMDTCRELFLSKEGLLSREYSAVCLPNDWGYEASVKTSLELDVYFCGDTMLMIIFDPGGSPLYVKRGSVFMPNNDMQNLDLRLDEFNSARFDLSCTTMYSHHKNDLVYSASRECQNVKFFADPERSYYLSRIWILNGVICEDQSPDPKSKNGLRSIVSHQHWKVDKGVVFSFDPGGNFPHNRAGPYQFKLSFAKPFCFLCINTECFRKSRKNELQVNDVLRKLISTAQAFTYNHSRDNDGMYLELEHKAVRVDEELNGAFTRYAAHLGLRFDFKEAPGVNNMILDNRLHIGSINYLHHNGYIHTTLFKFGCFALMIASRKTQIMIEFLVKFRYAFCFLYILGDKDVAERVGNDILLMDSILVILSNWCNDSDKNCLMNSLVNTLLSPLECFRSDSITFQVCRTKSAFI